MLRHFCIEAVNGTIRQPNQDPAVLEQIQVGLFEYVFKTYSLAAVSAAGSVVDTPHIQNKLSEAFTALFVVLYSSTLPHFFRQFRTLACGDGVDTGSLTFNPAGALFFIRVLVAIHDEIADVLITRPHQIAVLHSQLKDLIRERDVNTVVELWSTVLSQWDQLEVDISDGCLRSIARWVQWIEVSLVVKNRHIMSALCTIVNPNFLPPGPFQNSPMTASRTKLLYTAVDTFTGIVSKKSAAEKKIELIHSLDLTNLVSLLVRSRQLAEFQATEHYDNDLAENVAKLVNTVILDLVYIVDSKETKSTAPQTLDAARALILEYLPFLLRFLSDQYDGVSNTVIPATTNLVAWYRKAAEKSSATAIESELSSILAATTAKVQYDSSIDEDDDLDENEEAFVDLRKKLAVLQKMIAEIHRPLFVSSVNKLIDARFDQFKIDRSQLSWRDVEVALYELGQYADVYPRIGSISIDGQRTQPLADEVIKRISTMIEIDVASYPSTTTQLLFLDVCTKFLTVLEVRPELIQPALGAYLRLAHSPTQKVRHRAWAALSRFVSGNISQHLKPISKDVMMNLEDLLVINATVSDLLTDETLSEEDKLLDENFKAQLFLFESISSLLSLLRSEPADFGYTTQLILGTFCNAITSNVEAAKNGAPNELLVIHHNIMALGTIAHKLGAAHSGNFDPELSRVFEHPSQTIVTALLALSHHKSVRFASRFALTRLVDVLRGSVAPQLESWLSGLVSAEISVAELVHVLPLLNQMIYILKADMEPILASRMPLIVSQVLARLNRPAAGTDEQLQLMELQREFFSFLLYCLSHRMARVFTMESNNETFQNVILFLHRAAKGETNYGSVGLAFKVINKIIVVYGGPGDVLSDGEAGEIGLSQPAAAVGKVNKAKLAGGGGGGGSGAAEAVSPYAIGQFVNFVIDLFHPLVWVVPTKEGFKIEDSDGKEVVKEILVLQVLLAQKGGAGFVKRICADVGSIPMFGPESAMEYVSQMYGTAVHRLANAPATAESFGSVGPAGADGPTAVPFAADPKVKEFRKYFEGVVVHIRRQKGL